MRIVILAAPFITTNYLFNCVSKNFDDVTLLIEPKPKVTKFYRYRIKKLGLLTATGQFCFQIYSKLTSPLVKSRIQFLEHKYNLSGESTNQFISIPSVNSPQCIELLTELNPDIVLLNGTGIVKAHILKLAPLFLNIHTGITPKYRGVHGGYWALANGDRENCGVTIHSVDTGVDTGSVHWQGSINPDSEDNLFTYPVHQYGVALPQLIELLALKSQNKSLPEVKVDTTASKQYFHPTLWSYLSLRWKSGVG